MKSMHESEFREHVKKSLENLNSPAQSAILREINGVADLGHSERLQFEAQPSDFRISLIQTEEEIVESGAVDQAISFEVIETAEENDVDWQSCISEELVSWFSERWIAVDGPKHFSPAYIFYHGGLESPRFDLEQRIWLSVDQVWPETTV